ncbi:hypothetical protein [Lichenifustis flavocetrariae]|uniref:Uncharacterized protein n=1 Tax=Lichenifustis flavocetrariae TaxID=2949735 RepID=A0AA41YZI7_9HYPH|nr:hypothetical protein [Lichenifustis flavocetrariae]MCW6510181.1 hypothetical protein [Lichenifustis flavocetrariae]
MVHQLREIRTELKGKAISVGIGWESRSPSQFKRRGLSEIPPTLAIDDVLQIQSRIIQLLKSVVESTKLEELSLDAPIIRRRALQDMSDDRLDHTLIDFEISKSANDPLAKRVKGLGLALRHMSIAKASPKLAPVSRVAIAIGDQFGKQA